MSSPVVLATAGYDHKIRFWEAHTGICSKNIRFQESQVNCLSISSDKSRVAAGGNPLIHIFDINSNQDAPLLTYEGHTGNVTSVGFQKDGKWMYSGSEDGTVRIWDLRTPICQRNYPTQRPVNSVVLHPNQGELISGDQSGSVRFWDLQSNVCERELVPDPEVPIRSVSVAPDASLIAAGNHKGCVYVWRPEPSKEYTPLVNFQAHNAYLLKCVISPDANTLATTSSDRTINVWNTKEWDQPPKTLNQHQRWVWDAVFSADSSYLVSGSSDQTAKLWDVRSGEVVRNYSGHSLSVTCVALSDAAL